MSVATRQRQLVLIGGGHVHVQVLQAFATTPPDDCRITLIASEAVAMYSGMAPGFVAGDYSRDELSIDLRPLAAACNAEFIENRCERVFPELKRIELDDGRRLSYDVASFNVGSTLVGRNLQGVAEHTLPTRPLTKLIGGISAMIGRAKAHPTDQPFRLVVVGAGVAGIELAFTTQSRLRKETGRSIHTTVLDSAGRILASLPGAFVRRVERLADRRGISFCNDAKVVRICNHGVILQSGNRIDSDATLWVTGPAGHRLFPNSPGIETDDRGFAWTRCTLQLKNHEDIFAVGDCGTLCDYPHTPKAGVYAVRQGSLLAHNLRAQLCGEPLGSYKPQRDFLTLCNMGNGYAIGCKKNLSFGGRWVLRLKDRIDRAFMRRFQSDPQKVHD